MKRSRALLLALFGVSIIAISFNSSDRTIESKPAVFKKNVAIGAANKTAMPDTNAWLQIGDKDSSGKAAFLLRWTDSSKIGARKRLGMIALFTYDSSLWVNTGKRWKPIGK